jgi:hypothetical protein
MGHVTILAAGLREIQVFAKPGFATRPENLPILFSFRRKGRLATNKEDR